VRTSIAILVLLAAVIAWQVERERSRDQRMSRIASEIAGRPVEVDCPGLLRKLVDIRTEGGSVRFDASGKPSDVTHLESSVCDSLSAYGKTRRGRDFACVQTAGLCSPGVEKAVYSLLVLSHEAQHLRGVRSEGEAQCYAIQTMALVAERLGSPPEEARAVASHFLVVDQPRMPSEYGLSADCADGKRLDLDPASSAWPTGGAAG
jgi:hypothetical protein